MSREAFSGSRWSLNEISNKKSGNIGHLCFFRRGWGAPLLLPEHSSCIRCAHKWHWQEKNKPQAFCGPSLHSCPFCSFVHHSSTLSNLFLLSPEPHFCLLFLLCNEWGGFLFHPESFHCVYFTLSFVSRMIFIFSFRTFL